MDVFYSKHMFSIDLQVNQQLPSMNSFRWLNFARVTKLQLELQFDSRPNDYRAPQYHTFDSFSFTGMKSLRSLQICVTIQNTGKRFFDRRSTKDFHGAWHLSPYFTLNMRNCIAAIPAEVESLTWGLTKEKIGTRYYNNRFYVKDSVLRKIYKTYEAERGADVQSLEVAYLNETSVIIPRPVNGTGPDRD
jgi:hypothetical protein